MAYQRKTEDEWQLWVNYGQGWEHDLSCAIGKEIRGYVRSYRENVPQFRLKTKRVRVKIDA